MFCVHSLQPGVLIALRAGDGTASYGAKVAAPLFLDSFDATGALLGSLNVSGVTLTTTDHIEGDIELSPDGCWMSLLGYALPAGNSTASLRKTLVAAVINITSAGAPGGADGQGIDTSTTWHFYPGSDENEYSRADAAVRHPNGDVYMLAGQAGSCNVSLGHVSSSDPYTPVTSGFAARGISIAGREQAVYQLYVGGGTIIRRIGTGLPTSVIDPKLQASVITGGLDFGAGWEFENDTAFWAVDYTHVNATAHGVVTYSCAGDTPALPCPEGGTWTRTSTNFTCIIEGKERNAWYLAGNFTQDGSPPVLYLTTDDGPGASEVLRLDTATGNCTVFVQPQPKVVYRGLIVIPNVPCGVPSPSPSPSPVPTPTATATATATASAAATASVSSAATSTSQPSPEPANAPATGPVVPPGAVAGAAVTGVLVALGALGVLLLRRSPAFAEKLRASLTTGVFISFQGGNSGAPPSAASSLLRPASSPVRLRTASGGYGATSSGPSVAPTGPHPLVDRMAFAPGAALIPALAAPVSEERAYLLNELQSARQARQKARTRSSAGSAGSIGGGGDEEAGVPSG